MKIREFKIQDYDTVRALWQAAGLILRPGDELEDVKLKLQRDPDLFLVAEQVDEIVGSVIGGWDGRRGWIYHLAVKPEHQRKGNGQEEQIHKQRGFAVFEAQLQNRQIHRLCDA